MSKLKNRCKRLALTLGVVSILAIAAVAPAMASNLVTQTVNAGTRSASIASATLPPVTYSHVAQTNTGTLTLTADDSTGSDAGWNVTVQAGNFVDGSRTIAASNFSIGTPGTPSVNSGQAIDATNGPLAGVGGALNTARRVIFANAGFGKGNYSQSLPVTLTIPGQTLAGTYVSTLTVTIAAGPGV